MPRGAKNRIPGAPALFGLRVYQQAEAHFSHATLQILSTLLPSLEDDAFEFDSLLVYTCANNCEIPSRPGDKTGWQTEVAFKQDFAAAGVKFGGQ